MPLARQVHWACRYSSNMRLVLLKRILFLENHQKNRPDVDTAVRGKIILKWILKWVWGFSWLRIVSCGHGSLSTSVYLLPACPDLSVSLQPEDVSKSSKENGEGTVEQGTRLRLFHLNLALKTRFLFQATFFFFVLYFVSNARRDALGTARRVAITPRSFCLWIQIFNLQPMLAV
jgi:hypothetical protein